MARYFVRSVPPLLLLAFLATALYGQTGTGPCGANDGVCVVTWRQDTQDPQCPTCVYRAGQNLNENVITYSTIKQTGFNFGQMCSVALDGQVYAQPLLATNVTINSLTYAYVVYLATQNDTLYAIDGTPHGNQSNGYNCDIIKSVSLLPAGHNSAACGDEPDGCQTINPYIGILSTPVIHITTDGNGNNTGALYAVTESEDRSKNFYHYLHKVDIQTLVDTISSNPIAPSGCQPSNGCKFSEYHIQRPALLYVAADSNNDLQNDTVYAAFSMIDGGQVMGTDPNGVIFSFNANTLAQQTYLQTSQGTSGSEGAGMWMGGAGPSYGPDSSGSTYHIFAATANGTFDGSSNWGDSVLKLDPATLAVKDYFTPSDFAWRDCNDADVGSSGVTLLPNDETSPDYAAVVGDKEGGIWFLNRANLGQCHNSSGGSCNTSYQCSSHPQQDCTKSPSNPTVYWTGGTGNECRPPNSGNPTFVIHNSPAFWESSTQEYLYVAPTYSTGTNNALTQYPLCAGQSPPTPPVCTTIGTKSAYNTFNSGYGITPVTTQKQTDNSDAILWAIQGNPSAKGGTGALLFALDAVSSGSQTRLQVLYTNHGCATTMNPATKAFSVPTVANGYVYIGTQGNTSSNPNGGTFSIYGPNSPGGC